MTQFVLLFFFRVEKGEELPHPGVSLAVQMTQGLMSNDVLKLDSVLRESKLEIIQVWLNLNM